MTDRLEEIKQREAKATLGEWHVGRYLLQGEIPVYCEEGAEFVAVCVSKNDKPVEANAEFIAHSRQDIPYLLRRLEAAEAVIGFLYASPYEEVFGAQDAWDDWQKAKEGTT